MYNQYKGASRYDVRKIFGFFYPLPQVRIDLDQVYSIKFMQTPLPRPLYHAPSPSEADIISGSSLNSRIKSKLKPHSTVISAHK